ncbi:MAG: hypothetical protein ACI3YK_07905 [Eubacteriales bacterium]
MKYIFFDIECANCYQGKGKICSFGYVITDEAFHITEQHDMVINPASKFNLGPDIKLAYSKSEFKQSPLFPMFYDEIEALLTDPDGLVFGFSVSNDARYVRDECKRYNLPPINYQFYDVQQMFMGFEGVKNQPSLAKICEQYSVPESQEIHKSDLDSKMTMEVLEALCKATGKSVPELIEEYPRAVGESMDGEVRWLHPPVKESHEASVSQGQSGSRKKNTMSLYSPAYKRFCRYVKGLAVNDDPDSLFHGQKICISANYEERHCVQMKEIAARIADRGGRYWVYASECDLFVSYDYIKADGTVKKCARLAHVQEAIEKGKEIKILPLAEFLELLDTDEAQLDALLLPEADETDSDETVTVDSEIPIAVNT